MPNEINDGGINSLLVRRLNVVDTPAPAGTVAPEVFPTFNVAPPSLEDDYLRGVFLAGGVAHQPGAAGQYANIRLANLPGSGIITIVDRILVNAGSNGAILAGVSTTTTPFANVRQSGMRDARIRPFSTARGTLSVLSSETNISPPVSAVNSKLLAAWLQATTVLNQVEIGVVLPPGTSWEIGINDVNVYLFITVFFRERRAQPSELV